MLTRVLGGHCGELTSCADVSAGSTLLLEAKCLPTEAQKYLFFLLTSTGEVRFRVCALCACLLCLAWLSRCYPGLLPRFSLSTPAALFAAWRLRDSAGSVRRGASRHHRQPR